MADEILRQGITGISDIVVKPGLINVDFADVRSVMSNAGPALMGIGRGFGKTRVALNGKVGGMKDDVVIALQIVTYFSKEPHMDESQFSCESACNHAFAEAQLSPKDIHF